MFTRPLPVETQTLLCNALLAAICWYLLPEAWRSWLFSEFKGPAGFALVMVGWMVADVTSTNLMGHDEEHALRALRSSDPHALRLFVRSGYSRVPVVGEDADDVRGIVYLKDLLRRLDAHPEHADRPVDSFTREPVYVPETKAADDLLREMQTDHVHMALAVDEYGGIAGLVTMEDLLEEVVGELTDEHDPAEPEVEDLGGGVLRVPARLGLDELGELFGLEIDDDDVDTAGGLLAKAIGRVPLPGASGDVQGLRIVADEATGRRRRVTSLLVSRAPAEGTG